MHQIRTILVATDFSPGSEAAFAQAVRLARASGATLHALHAVRHDAGDDLVQVIPDMAGEIDGYLRETGQKRLREAARAAGAPESVSLHVGVGSPAREVLELAEKVGADLLVLGATGEGGQHFGSVASRCVRKAAARVLLVPAGHPGAFTKVVVGVDFSEPSRTALEHAAHFARTDGASVEAVHVYEVPWELARWGAPPKDANRMADSIRTALEHRLRGMIPADAGVEVRCVLVRGVDYAKSLVAYAEEHHADLVVVGTTGRTALGYWLLGTTAEQVMRETRCAVLALRPQRKG